MSWAGFIHRIPLSFMYVIHAKPKLKQMISFTGFIFQLHSNFLAFPYFIYYIFSLKHNAYDYIYKDTYTHTHRLSHTYLHIFLLIFLRSGGWYGYQVYGLIFFIFLSFCFKNSLLLLLTLSILPSHSNYIINIYP